MSEQTEQGPSAESDATEAYIGLVYNTPELHGSYCPCADCERIAGPLPEWIHEIGKRVIPPASTEVSR